MLQIVYQCSVLGGRLSVTCQFVTLPVAVAIEDALGAIGDQGGLLSQGVIAAGQRVAAMCEPLRDLKANAIEQSHAQIFSTPFGVPQGRATLWSPRVVLPHAVLSTGDMAVAPDGLVAGMAVWAFFRCLL